MTSLQGFKGGRGHPGALFAIGTYKLVRGKNCKLAVTW